MKKTLWMTGLILITILWVSCKKDEEKQTTNKNSHRIKEEIYHSSGTQYKTVYGYTNEKISQTVNYRQDSTNWLESGKSEYLYEDNKITETYYQYKNGNWTSAYQVISTFSNNNLIETQSLKFATDGWQPYYKQTFSYSEGKLVSEKYGEYTEGVWTPYSSVEIVYSGNRCTGYLGYSYSQNVQGELTYKGDFIFSGNNISELIISLKNEDSTWRNDQKSVYEYSNNKLISVKDYEWNSALNEWKTEVWASNLYVYNSDNYLSRHTYTLPAGGIDYSFDYIYEEGHGNGEALLNSPDANVLGTPVIRKSVSDISSGLHPIHSH